MSKLVIKVGSIEEQRELFLWRFHDVSRDLVRDLEKGSIIFCNFRFNYSFDHYTYLHHRFFKI